MIAGLLDFSASRTGVPAGIGVGAGWAIYRLSGDDSSAAAAAVALGLCGILAGAIRQMAHRLRMSAQAER